MQIEAILSMMISERDKIDRALAALQGTAKRRGRPPKLPVVMVQAVDCREPEDNPVRRYVWSAAQRRAHSLRVKAQWAARRQKAA